MLTYEQIEEWMDSAYPGHTRRDFEVAKAAISFAAHSAGAQDQPQAAEPTGLTEHLYILSANEGAMESAIEAFEGSSEGEGLKSVLHAQKQLRALLSKGA